MTKMVREYLDVADNMSLDDVIGVLTALRETLPAGAHAEVRMRGDDVFGRRLTICYDRAQTAAEAELETRYGDVADRRLAPVPADVASYERVQGEVSLAA
jgi:hypothetical protein